MNITDSEAKEIAKEIQPIFACFVERYDEKKYPPTIYECTKKEYSARQKMNSQIEKSIKWKYGKSNSSGMTSAHTAIVYETQKLWPKYIEESCSFTAKETFDWWSSSFGRNTTYITAAYITHLIHHVEQLPIIDQHNYRAMCALLKKIKPSYKVKRAPSNWTDVDTLRNFMLAIQKQLKERPSLGEVDRFLMMYGKSLKQRRVKKPV